MKPFDYPVGFVSLAILREFYKDYIIKMSDNGIYKGDIKYLEHYIGLEKILGGVEIETKQKREV